MLTYYPDKIATHDVDYYNRERQIKWINLCMLPGIKTYHNVDKGEMVPSFGYQSLISLMYLEFMFDVKNSRIPRRCSK